MARKNAIAAVCLLLVLVFLPACEPEAALPEAEGKLLVSFIDVGQGDAALLIGPSGRSLLIDCGQGAAYGPVERAIKKAGLSQPETILISHPHSDHMGSLPGILINMGADRLYLNSEVMDSRLYRASVREAEARGLEFLPMLPGQEIPWEEAVQIQVLGPLPGASDVNNRSAVVRVRFGDHSFLFTGDIEAEAEKALVERYGSRLQSTVVKVPHHGSASSSSPAFVEAVGASIGVLSFGDNAYGHPDPEVVARWQGAGSELYATKTQGSMTFESDGSRLFLTAEKSLEAFASPTWQAAA